MQTMTLAMAEQAWRRRLLRRAFIHWTHLAAMAALVATRISQSSADQPSHTLQRGILRVGTYFVNPPFEFISHHVQTRFEIDLMNQIAGRLGLHASFVNTRWEIILQQMEGGQFDCIIGGISITPRRREQLAWSIPYMTTTLSLIVNARTAPETMTLGDLRSATVGAQAATTDYDAAIAMQRRGTIGRVKVYPFARIADAIADLTAGHIDAIMKLYPVAAWLVRRTPGLRILGQVADDPQRLGIGFGRSDTTLLAAVNHALVSMQHDGSYRDLARHWGVP